MRKPKAGECSICGEYIMGFGHNAQPVNDGRCCDVCNDIYVIPTRLGRIFSKEKSDGPKAD
jgi:hypothetical protein